MQNSNIKILLFGSYFILSLAPIGIETSILSSNFENITIFFNFFRLIIPIVIFFLLYYLFFFKKLNTKKLLNTFFVFLFFVVIFLTTLLSLENFNEGSKLLLPFYCINYIFLVFVALNTNEIKQKFNKFFFVQFIIITIITLYSLFQYSYSFINLNLSDLYGLGIENDLYNQNSNGLSRVLLVISLFIFLVGKKNKYFFYLSCLIINTLIILLQSKLVLSFLFLFILLKTFLGKNIIKEKIKNIFFTLAIPVLIAILISMINSSEKIPKIRLLSEFKYEMNSDNWIATKEYPNPITISSGFKTRFDTWKLILQNSKKPFVGYGSQADKYITRNLPKHTQIGANSFIYAYACAGLIGVISLIIVYYNIINLLLRAIFLRKSKSEFSNLKLFYCTILCFLIYRSFFENSFALWGIDFVLMINSYFGLKNILTKKIK